jgi:Leucine-rich repeat (LRR) protein
MKKLLLILLSITIIISCKKDIVKPIAPKTPSVDTTRIIPPTPPVVTVQVTLIPDQNFENGLIALGFDDVLDGKVLTSKISSITKLKLEHLRIKDITGIENFIGLEFLSLWDNDFTSINVRSLKNLKSLCLSECPIDTIDLSQNKELVEIAFQNASNRASDPSYPYGKTLGFTKLDLKHNVKMERIYLWTNRITELDVSMLPRLTDLWIGGSVGNGLNSGNPIKSLDLSKNSNLNVIVAGGCDLQFLNIKGTANNGVPRTCTTHNNPNLFEIKVTSVTAINAYANSSINGGLVSNIWYAKDEHTKYVE